MRNIPNKVNQNNNNQPNSTTLTAGELRSLFNELKNVLGLVGIAPGELDSDFEDLDQTQVAESIVKICQKFNYFTVENFDESDNIFTLKRAFFTPNVSAVPQEFEKFYFIPPQTFTLEYPFNTFKVKFLDENNVESQTFENDETGLNINYLIVSNNILECYIANNDITIYNKSVLIKEKYFNPEFSLIRIYDGMQDGFTAIEDPIDGGFRLWWGDDNAYLNDAIDENIVVLEDGLDSTAFSSLTDVNFRVEMRINDAINVGEYKLYRVRLLIPNTAFDAKTSSGLLKQGIFRVVLASDPSIKLFEQNFTIQQATPNSTPILATGKINMDSMATIYNIVGLSANFYWQFEFSFLNNLAF